MIANRRFNFICAAAVASTFATGLISAPSWAQEVAQTTSSAPAAESAKNSDQIQTVIITANKRKEDASKVALSISVIGGDDLVAQHIDDFASATRAIPNISFSSGGGSGNAGNGPGLSNIEIRGISSSGGASTVGVYLDDISLSAGNVYSMGTAEPKFFDVDHIEVLRGPQGTLYGASSMGGTIKFISNQPSFNGQETNLSGDVSSTKGGGVNHTETAVFNEVLMPNELALRIGVQTSHKGGYIDQVNPNSGSVIASGINWEDDRVARLALKWAPTKNLTLTPGVFYQQVNAGDIDVSYLYLANGSNLPKNQTPKLVREPGKDVIVAPNLTVNYSTDAGDLTSVTSYFKRVFNRTQDGTTVNSTYLGNQQGSTVITDPALAAVVAGLPSAVFLNNELTQFSQEVRFASKPYDPSVSPFTWVVGAYVSNMNTNIIDNEPIYGINAAFAAAGQSPNDPNAIANAVANGFPNDNSYFSHRYFHDEQKSIFGEANYYVMPTLHFTAGLRYLKATDSFMRVGDYYFAGGPTLNAKTTSEGNKLTPKFAVAWEVTPTDTLYATAAEGFRVGGPNFALPLPYCGTVPNPLSYKPDSLWSYEVGDKSRFLNNRLSINADLFYIDWKQLQQSITNSTCGFAYNTNVGSATSTGGEIEIKYKPTSQIVLDLAGGYDHAVLADSDAAAVGVKGAVKGANIPGVPKFNAALTGVYSFNLSGDVQGFVRGAAHWTGPSNGSLDPTNPDFQRPAYANVDLSTGASFGIYDFSLYVKNVADSQKVIQHPEVQYANNGQVYRLNPRTIGVTFSAKF
ncbi:iron complex outermembrane receptor protein [Oxalobacteraceae bacterium GrIS 2.11]